MNTKGIEQAGVFTPDNLIAGNRHPVDVRHVIIKAGQVLKRGTVLKEDMEEPGKYVILGTGDVSAAASETEEGADTGGSSEKAKEAEYILAEDVDASEEDAVIAAYYAGEFAENALIVKDGYQMTEKDRKAFRNAGIFLKTIMM